MPSITRSGELGFSSAANGSSQVGCEAGAACTTVLLMFSQEYETVDIYIYGACDFKICGSYLHL